MSYLDAVLDMAATPPVEPLVRPSDTIAATAALAPPAGDSGGEADPAVTGEADEPSAAPPARDAATEHRFAPPTVAPMSSARPPAAEPSPAAAKVPALPQSAPAADSEHHRAPPADHSPSATTGRTGADPPSVTPPPAVSAVDRASDRRDDRARDVPADTAAERGADHRTDRRSPAPGPPPESVVEPRRVAPPPRSGDAVTPARPGPPVTDPVDPRREAPARPDARPTISVHIGRIVVQPPAAPAPRPTPARPAPSASSLDDYLRRRSS